MKKKGKLFVFSAPSGSGKTSIVRYLLEQPELKLEFSVSATSRPKRPHEVHGKDYYFITEEAFKEDIEKGKFAEWEEVYNGSFYGTYKHEIDRILNEGKNVVFDIDVIGGLNIKKMYPEQTLAIFIKPPSVEELERRLRLRNTEEEKRIAERVDKAVEELSYEKYFDIVVINDDLKQAQKDAYEAVKKFIEE